MNNDFPENRFLMGKHTFILQYLSIGEKEYD
jgi:hypothetical protein